MPNKETPVGEYLRAFLAAPVRGGSALLPTSVIQEHQTCPDSQAAAEVLGQALHHLLHAYRSAHEPPSPLLPPLFLLPA